MSIMTTKCFGPLFKQCFLTSGVSINFASHGLVMGFTSVLLPRLKNTTDIDEASATWIASIFGISLIIGTLIVPILMDAYGRKTANIISAALMTAGWITFTVAERASSLLFARFIQGLSMGLLANMGNILIGECCSPQNRGPLLATISLSLMLGVFLVHWLGTIISSWHTIALIFSFIAFIDLIIIILSPESPSFYALKGRYSECRKAFRWLRGPTGDEELEELIKINVAKKSNKIPYADKGIFDKVKRKIAYIKNIFSKKEVYKPVIIMLHLYGIGQWCGSITFDTYTIDIVNTVLGTEANYSVVIVSLDLQRLVSNFIAILVIKRMRRKVVLAITISVNVMSLFSIALYVYLKTHGLLGFDHIYIGLVLIHINLCTTVTGAMTLTNIIAGEIFPLEHRGLCGMTGILFFSINETINIKSARYLFSSVGVHGAYTIYGVLMAYFLTVVLYLLPETKDRDLLDIEEEFRGKPVSVEGKLIENNSESEKV